MNRYRERDAVAISTLPAHHELRSISFRVSIAIGFFFGLSVLFYVLVAIADSQIPGGVGVFVWGRSITELVLACAYFLFAYLFRRGKFWGYMRLLMTSALALVSTLSVVLLSGDYPWWLRVEQAVQAGAVLMLFYVLLRPVARHYFAKKEKDSALF